MRAGRRDCADKLESNLGAIGTYAKRASRSVRQRFCSFHDDGDIHRLPPLPSYLLNQFINRRKVHQTFRPRPDRIAKLLDKMCDHS
jgi:hypothetical protein